MPSPTLPAAAIGVPRHRIEAAIEALLALLDAAEPDPDLEPTLGWTDRGIVAGSDDRELDDDVEHDAVDQADEDTTPEMWKRPLAFGERP